MKLFVGLGNPGAEYAFNRHNVGFMAADAIAATHGFPAWRKRFQGLAAEGRLGREQVLLLKPQTYMNESGRSVGEAVRFYKLDLADVIVFHDELDLVPGKVRVKAGGGVAGHNGLRSITAHIGNDYVRVRIGIGHPGSKESSSTTCSTISPRPIANGSSRCSAPSPRRRPISPKGPTTSFNPLSLTPCIWKPILPMTGPSLPRASARMRQAPGATSPPPAEGPFGKLRRWFGLVMVS